MDSGYARGCALTLDAALIASFALVAFYYGEVAGAPLLFSGAFRGGAAVGCLLVAIIFLSADVIRLRRCAFYRRSCCLPVYAIYCAFVF